MVVQQSGNTILTRWYSGSSYVKETAVGVTKQYTYIGGDAYTAPVVAIKTGTGTTVYYYLLRDYLGNITHVVNTSKTLVAEYSYDAWGRMRNPTNWTNYAPGTEPALFVAGRGFTGHEHLPWFNSINMNGRVYDPLIGQFLSPDNYVQSPDFTQNFNRYSYCLNNPLKFTDPSGMRREALPNPADAGFPYNPEAAAWLANYYNSWEYNYGGIPGYGGGGGGGINTVTGFWDSHASSSGILGYRWEGDNRIDNATGKIVGVRQNGHYEKVITKNNGTIHGNRLNNKTDPNLIDEVSVVYKWVWDIPSENRFKDWITTRPDLDRYTVNTLNSMSIVLGSVTALAYGYGGPLVGGFVSGVLIVPSIGISVVTTLDTWGDYFRNPNPSKGDLVHVYISTAVTTLGTFYWPSAIPAGVYGIIDTNGKFNWKRFDE
jgi:RHS repeat-associated protein